MKSLIWLKQIRHNKNMTQADVAELIGGSREQYNAYECGRVEPQEFTKYKISQALDFDVSLWSNKKQ